MRGFKDPDAGNIDSDAGTSQTYSQILLLSETVCRGWDVRTMDMSNAFLQGVTYEELSEMTGEPIREVHFDLPAGSIPISKQVEGFEDFDPMKEVLHCDKPAQGLLMRHVACP